eukprot:scaffold20811_cov97-Isochrysis_galbana.AAC.1
MGRLEDKAKRRKEEADARSNRGFKTFGTHASNMAQNVQRGNNIRCTRPPPKRTLPPTHPPTPTGNDRPLGPGPIWEYPYGWPAREACCPDKGQRGE